PLVRAVAGAMVEKYAALAALEALAGGPEQDAALRAAAGRWPGCLRESQLAGPGRCEQRRAQAAEAAAGPELPRAVWRERGATAVGRGADLHPLLADLLAWRRQHAGRGGPADLLAFVRRTAPGRWPDEAALLERVGGPQVRARLAYAWLAA